MQLLSVVDSVTINMLGGRKIPNLQLHAIIDFLMHYYEILMCCLKLDSLNSQSVSAENFISSKLKRSHNKHWQANILQALKHFAWMEAQLFQEAANKHSSHQ